MSEKSLLAVGGQTFEDLKQANAHGAEYWSARDLQSLLGYSQWRRFEQAIERAKTSCKESGNSPDHHFAGAGKPITGGKGAVQLVEDYHLSRFACYLIAQNGDPRKPEIAQAQKYFAVQTRRQELSDQAAADLERLELRKQTAEEFKALSGTAQDAGVQNNWLERSNIPVGTARTMTLVYERLTSTFASSLQSISNRSNCCCAQTR